MKIQPCYSSLHLQPLSSPFVTFSFRFSKLHHNINDYRFSDFLIDMGQNVASTYGKMPTQASKTKRTENKMDIDIEMASIFSSNEPSKPHNKIINNQTKYQTIIDLGKIVLSALLEIMTLVIFLH